MYKLVFLDIEAHKERPWKDLTLQKKQAFVNHYYKQDEDVYSTDDWNLFFEQKPENEEELKTFIHLKNVERQYNMKSGLIPEFGRVICVSIGIEDLTEDLRVMCFKGPDEKKILMQLKKVLDKVSVDDYGIAGWNIINYDIPYLAKRYIINEISVPITLNPIGSKPWERRDQDVMLLWRCSGYQSVSLEVACASLNIPVKFTEHTGKDLWEIELEDMDWDMVEKYCNNDMYSSYLIYKLLDKIGYL